MATAIAGVIAGLQVVIYDRPLSGVTWLSDDFPKILAMSFVLSVVGSAIYELVRLIGGRVLLNVILRAVSPPRPRKTGSADVSLDLHRLDFPGRGAG